MKVFIDAGHNYSGFDTGAQGNGLREEIITYEISEKLAKKLTDAGFWVKMSRNNLSDSLGNDLNTSLMARADSANAWGADYFISIHCNSFTDQSAKGTEVLILSLGGKAEKLANDVLDSLVKSIKTVNRGVKEQNLSVLRNTLMPAILVETAFISNKDDSYILQSRQDDISNGIFTGILSYTGFTPDSSDQPSDWAKEAIKWAIENGISDGDRPKEFATREEALTFLYRYYKDSIIDD